MLGDILTFLGGCLASFIALYLGVMRPREQKRKKYAAALAEKQALHDQVLDGVKPVPGMTEGQLAIAVRVQATEVGLKEVKTELQLSRDELKENTAAVSTMSLRQRQQNGDVREMKGMVSALARAVAELLGRPISLTPEETEMALAAHEQVNTDNKNQILKAIGEDHHA